ncbi:MAG: 1,6-anhydro-N-acetylmuramyl-L-alanine amidase AmpD [Neisseriaceae bacterium]|nr:1,6-anhydro-N-acetylmuramyl-L-alanine amidase AmpD [Neisseriaceae bacterium]
MQIPLHFSPKTGRIQTAQFIASPNHDSYPNDAPPCLLIIHNISLPPFQYGGNGVVELFTNQLNPNEHPYYASIAELRVSAHFFVRRTGELIQFVPTTRRAWHAGVSCFEGRTSCNDFSIGIEMEGSDAEVFDDIQYLTLSHLIETLAPHFPFTAITGHEHVAIGRKTDPGPFFDWPRLAANLAELNVTIPLKTQETS